MSQSDESAKSEYKVVSVRCDPQIRDDLEDLTDEYPSQSEATREVLRRGIEWAHADKSHGELRDRVDELEAELNKNYFWHLSWAERGALIGAAGIAVGVTPMALSIAATELFGYMPEGEVTDLLLVFLVIALAGTLLFTVGSLAMLIVRLVQAAKPDVETETST